MQYSPSTAVMKSFPVVSVTLRAASNPTVAGRDPFLAWIETAVSDWFNLAVADPTFTSRSHRTAADSHLEPDVLSMHVLASATSQRTLSELESCRVTIADKKETPGGEVWLAGRSTNGIMVAAIAESCAASGLCAVTSS